MHPSFLPFRPVFLLMLFISGCSSDPMGTEVDEPNNTHVLLKTPQGDSVSFRGLANCPPELNVEGACSISQFKKGYRFSGVPYAQDWNYVPIDVKTGRKADIDGDGVEDRVAKYSGNLATFSAKHYPVAIDTGERVYFVFSGPAYLDDREHDNTVLSPLLATSYKQIDPNRLGCSGCKTPFTTKLNAANELATPALGIYVAYYDSESKTLSLPVLAHVKNTDDPHDNAVINIDSQGHLYVLISGRSNSRGALLLRSSQPHDIASFDNITPSAPRYAELAANNNFAGYTSNAIQISYPKLFWVDDDGGYFRLIFSDYCDDFASPSCGGRSLMSAKIVINDDEPARYDEVQQLSRYLGHYAIANAKGTDLVVAFNLHVNGTVDDRTNLYYLHSSDGGSSWQNAYNQPVSLPLNSAQDLSQVSVVEHHAHGEEVRQRIYLKDIQFTGTGENKNPVILFVSVSNQLKGYQPRLNADIQLLTTFFTNSSWVLDRVSHEVDHAYSTGMLHVTNDLDYAVFFPRSIYQNGLAGGSLAKANKSRSQLLESSLVNLTVPVDNPATTANYFDTLCEFNYARAVHKVAAQQTDIIGIVAAGNPFQYSNYNPLFLIGAADIDSAVNPVYLLPESMPSSSTQAPAINVVDTCKWK